MFSIHQKGGETIFSERTLETPTHKVLKQKNKNIKKTKNNYNKKKQK